MAERPSLRLPAPPAKRQRAVSLDEEGAAETADTQEADPGAAHSAAACGRSPLDAPVAAELDLPVALPNDAMVALLLLKSRFPLEAKVIPFATRSQLYTLLSDRTEADRQVEELRRANHIRLIQLPAGGGRGGEEHALLLTEDYLAALRRCRAVLLQQHRQQQLQQQPGDGGIGSGNKAGSLGAGAAGAAAGRAAADQPPGIEAFGWFAMRVLPACTETVITHSELLALLGRSSSSKPATASEAAAAGASLDTATASAAPQRVTDAHVSLLLSHGFLVRHTAAADGYLFGMPQAGMAVRSVAAGRQEILSLLHRRRQPELLEAELAKRRLQRSVLGVRWHVADLVGSGALLRLPTPVGPLLRVAKRGG